MISHFYAIRAAAYPYQRLGQAFCNHFGLSPSERTDNGRMPDLFYEEDWQRAKQRIDQFRIRWQER